jgi:DNA ligase-1
MQDLKDGESFFMQGSGSKPYELKNVGGVYSCTCPAWRNQSLAIEKRTCKHLRKLRSDAAEEARVGSAVSPPRKKIGEAEDKAGPPLLLAERWDQLADLQGWWMSEKLDGIRAYWDGSQFLSRLGNVLHAPEWFTQGLPGEPLDGELWIARKAFQRTTSIVRRQDKSNHWREVRYVVFDAPAHEAPFEGRLAFFHEFIGREKPPFAVAHPHEVCRGLDHLRKELKRIEALGGEGLMLRQPRSQYQVGRSWTLLKVKSFLDAEARVIAHKAGSGRHKGRLGALSVELADGTRFDVGTGFSDAEREDPPPIGSIISFRYQELSEGGVPRFPSFVAVREDIELSPPPPPSPKPPSAPVHAHQAGIARRFEFVEGKSAKFWEVEVQGKEMTTRWGRIGTSGQSKTKTFADPSAAKAAADKLIAAKTEEGYDEVVTS